MIGLRLHPEEKISWFETGLRSAIIISDVALQANHLSTLGLAYFNLGEYERAIHYHSEALILVQEIGDVG